MITISGTGGKPSLAFAKLLRGAVKASPREEPLAVVPVVESLMDADYNARVEPTSRSKWAPRVPPTGGWPLLEKTGKMRASRIVRPILAAIRLSYSSPGEYHQRGTPRMVARRILPVLALPPGWSAQIGLARVAWWRKKLGLS